MLRNRLVLLVMALGMIALGISVASRSQAAAQAMITINRSAVDFQGGPLHGTDDRH